MNIRHRMIQDEYDVAIAVGYYINGIRLLGNGSESEPWPAKKQYEKMCNQLAKFAMEANVRGLKALFVLYDDGSPERGPDPMQHIGPADFIHVFSEENRGVGFKENLLQTIGSAYAPVVIRNDADISFRCFTIGPAMKAMEDLPDAFACNGAIGRLGAYVSEAEYVPMVGVGQFFVYRSSAFDVTGYTDPDLRFFEDRDMVERARAHGFGLYTISAIKAGAKRTGANATYEKRVEMAKLLEARAPWFRVSYRRKDGNPIVRTDRSRVSEIRNRVVPPSPEALEILEELKNGGKR